MAIALGVVLADGCVGSSTHVPAGAPRSSATRRPRSQRVVAGNGHGFGDVSAGATTGSRARATHTWTRPGRHRSAGLGDVQVVDAEIHHRVGPAAGLAAGHEAVGGGLEAGEVGALSREDAPRRRAGR